MVPQNLLLKEPAVFYLGGIFITREMYKDYLTAFYYLKNSLEIEHDTAYNKVLSVLKNIIESYEMSAWAHELKMFKPEELATPDILTKTLYTLKVLYLVAPDTKEEGELLAKKIQKIIINNKLEERGIKR